MPAHRRGGPRHLLPVHHRRARHGDRLARLLLRATWPRSPSTGASWWRTRRSSRRPSRSCCAGRARCRPCPGWLAEDVEFDGCPVKAGEQVMLLIGVGQHRRRRPPRGRHRRPAAQPQSPPGLRWRRPPLPGLAPGPDGAAGGAAGIPPADPRVLARARHGARVHRGPALAAPPAAAVRPRRLSASACASGSTPSRCQGHGRCYTLAPDLFDADDHGPLRVAGRRGARPGARTKPATGWRTVPSRPCPSKD